MAKLAAFTILFTAKACGETRLVQYVITAKNPFKTNIDTLQVILSNFKKKHLPQDFCISSALQPYSLTALQPAIRPTSSRCMSPVFRHNVGDRCLITHMLF